MRLHSKTPSQGCGFTLSKTRLRRKKAHHQRAPSPPGASGCYQNWGRWTERSGHTPNGCVESNTPLPQQPDPHSTFKRVRTAIQQRCPNLKCLRTTPGSRESSQPLQQPLQGWAGEPQGREPWLSYSVSPGLWAQLANTQVLAGTLLTMLFANASL